DVGPLYEPCPPLGFRNLSRGHLPSEVRPAFLGKGVSPERGQVEPFMRFDEVDLGSGAGTVGHAEIEARSGIAFKGILHSAVDKNACAWSASSHAGLLPVVLETLSALAAKIWLTKCILSHPARRGRCQGERLCRPLS